MRKILALILFFSLAVSAEAENLYVTDSFQITLRTGQGIEHKIVSMISSGEKVEVLENQEKWTKIKRKNGVEGWVLSRFLTEEKPNYIKLNSLTRQHESLLKNSEKNDKELVELRTENSALKKDLKTIKKELKEIKSKYSKLKKESSDFLNLKEKYENNHNLLEENIKKSEDLESKLMERNIKVFIAGAVVMLIGFIFGLSAKRKKRGLYY